MAVAGAVALGALLKSTTLSTKRNLVNLGEGRSSAARGGDDGRGGDDRLNKPADDGKDNKEKWSSRKRMVKVTAMRQHGMAIGQVSVNLVCICKRLS